jgi:hypothetical protein
MGFDSRSTSWALRNGVLVAAVKLLVGTRPLAIHEFKHCQFSTVGEMVEISGGGYPINSVKDVFTPTMSSVKVLELLWGIVFDEKTVFEVGGDREIQDG